MINTRCQRVEEGEGSRSPGLMSAGKGYPTLAQDLSHDACDVPTPLPLDRQLPGKTLSFHNFV